MDIFSWFRKKTEIESDKEKLADLEAAYRASANIGAVDTDYLGFLVLQQRARMGLRDKKQQ